MSRVGEPIDRRRFLQIAAAGAAGLALTGCAEDGTTKSAAAKKRIPAQAKRPTPRTAVSAIPTVTQTTLASGVVVPTAPWLIAENKRPGTLDWIVNFVQPDHAL